MYGIYANIGGILMGSMLPYIAYMDPMGIYRKKPGSSVVRGMPTIPTSGLCGSRWDAWKMAPGFSRRHGLQTGAHCGSLAKDLEGANFFEDSADIIVADSEKPQHGFWYPSCSDSQYEMDDHIPCAICFDHDTYDSYWMIPGAVPSSCLRISTAYNTLLSNTMRVPVICPKLILKEIFSPKNS